MEYRFLGKTGLQVSALSFGAWVTFGAQLNDDLAYNSMKAAYDAGVNFFDNAESYAEGKAETIMGNVIKRAGWKRSDLVISSKLFWGGKGPNDQGLSRKHILEGAHNSLKRLQMDYVDVLFCHRPDIHTPIEETVWAMNILIQQGKTFYWGTSEWSPGDIMQAVLVARREHLIPPVAEQPQYNMFERQRIEKDYLPLYREIGLGTTVWSPLASGLLTGKHDSGIQEGTRFDLPGFEWLRPRIENAEGQRRVGVVKTLEPIAKELSCTMAQLALAWCLKNPNVSTVITGASRAEQVTENMKALDVLPKLTPDVMDRIEALLGSKPVLPPEDVRR
jgi:voltage-dependent potassium channel beta subunit